MTSRHAVHDGRRIGRREHAHGQTVEEQDRGELHVHEVRRQNQQTDERCGGQQHPARGERAGAVAVREAPGHGAGDEKAERERQHEDAGPQGRVFVVVAVQRQPDAL